MRLVSDRGDLQRNLSRGGFLAFLNRASRSCSRSSLGLWPKERERERGAPCTWACLSTAGALAVVVESPSAAR
jgi:hypothetical protein